MGELKKIELKLKGAVLLLLVFLFAYNVSADAPEKGDYPFNNYLSLHPNWIRYAQTIGKNQNVFLQLGLTTGYSLPKPPKYNISAPMIEFEMHRSIYSNFIPFSNRNFLSALVGFEYSFGANTSFDTLTPGVVARREQYIKLAYVGVNLTSQVWRAVYFNAKGYYSLNYFKVSQVYYTNKYFEASIRINFFDIFDK
ncbi:MAG: hypothetical protein KDC92_13480 [Bacteroidetes bacterium]|nr:hypothetical protein [Bacteroidota bacterium]